MQWIHVCLKFVLVIYLNSPIHAVWATFWNQLEYCNMRSDWRVNRGGGYGLEVPCQYLFKGNSLAVKWHSKTLFRVERFENDAFWKRCFLVWTEKTMLSEIGDVIDTTGCQTTRPWVSKVADRRYHKASLLISVAVWTGEDDTKTISVDTNLFENGTKQLRFQTD